MQATDQPCPTWTGLTEPSSKVEACPRHSSFKPCLKPGDLAKEGLDSPNIAQRCRCPAPQSCPTRKPLGSPAPPATCGALWWLTREIEHSNTTVEDIHVVPRRVTLEPSPRQNATLVPWAPPGRNGAPAGRHQVPLGSSCPPCAHAAISLRNEDQSRGQLGHPLFPTAAGGFPAKTQLLHHPPRSSPPRASA